jgi:hypothetical protein
MRLILTGLTAIAIAAAVLGQPAAPSGQAPDTFRKPFDALIAALKAKDFPGATGLMTAQARRAITQQVPPSKHAAFFANALGTMPISYDVESVSVSNDGKTATMMLVGMVPAEHGQQGQPAARKREITVEFAKEAGAWKIGPIQFGSDPDQRLRPKDLSMGQRSDYSAEFSTDMGGVILRIEKQEAGSVFVIRILDEEDAVFVPAAQVSPDFIAGAIVSFHAAKNENDPLKYWAESAKLEK